MLSYMVTQTEFEKHNDKKGHVTFELFDTLETANRVAKAKFGKVLRLAEKENRPRGYKEVENGGCYCAEMKQNWIGLTEITLVEVTEMGLSTELQSDADTEKTESEGTIRGDEEEGETQNKDTAGKLVLPGVADLLREDIYLLEEAKALHAARTALTRKLELEEIVRQQNTRRYFTYPYAVPLVYKSTNGCIKRGIGGTCDRYCGAFQNPGQQPMSRPNFVFDGARRTLSRMTR